MEGKGGEEGGKDIVCDNGTGNRSTPTRLKISHYLYQCGAEKRSRTLESRFIYHCLAGSWGLWMSDSDGAYDNAEYDDIDDNNNGDDKNVASR